jgi:hypothetical protein
MKSMVVGLDALIGGRAYQPTTWHVVSILTKKSVA